MNPLRKRNLTLAKAVLYLVAVVAVAPILGELAWSMYRKKGR